MSILIKGMEMPKEGSWVTLRLFPDGQCFLYSWCGNDFDFMEHVTAVPVPPHGRLIDADLLKERVTKRLYASNHGSMAEAYFAALIDLIDTAPTIIPASEEAE